MTRSLYAFVRRRVVLCCLSLSCAFAASVACAQDDVELELQYIAGLNEIGFPDYAERLLDDIRTRHPPEIVQRAEIKILGAQGKLDEAKAIIDSRPDANSPDTWRMRLELAELYYAWSQPEKFFAIYDQFVERFGANPPAGMDEFVVENVYRYAQFLLIMGRDDKAATALRTVYKAAAHDFSELRDQPLPQDAEEAAAAQARLENAEGVKKQMAIELAELLVKIGESDPARRKAAFDEAEKLAKEVQWGVVDIWFGRSVVVLAHIRVVQGDREGARKLITDYMQELQMIHAAIKDEAERTENNELLRLTPLAQCRYILGMMFHEEAKDKLRESDEASDPRQAQALRQEGLDLLIGKVVQRGNQRGRDPNAALQHLYNVFVQYPTTQWAVDAGKRSNAIIDRLSELGVEVKLGKVDMTEVVATQFREARATFQQNNFEAAIEKYLDVLNLFPEYDVSVDALGELAQSYAELERHREARMVIEYLADRFTADEQAMLKAGDTVARLAGAYARLDMDEQRDAVNTFFYARFQNHPQVHVSIFRRGEDYFQDKMYDKALDYFLRLVETEPPPSNYLDALYRAALCYSEMEDFANSLRLFDRYVDVVKEEGVRQSMIDVLFRMAEIYRKSGRNDIASARYHQIVKLLTGEERGKYEVSAAEREKNQKILEGAMFYRANSTSRRTEPPSRIREGLPTDAEYWQKQYKRLAVKYYEEYIERLPESEFVPDVLAQLAALYVTLEELDQAEAMLTRLQRDFRGTEQALRSLFSYADTLLDLGREREAYKVFKQMFEGDIEYPPSQVMEAGKALYGAGEYQIALDAFTSVLSRSDDARLNERCLLWKGKTERQLKQFAACAATIESLFQKHPRTAYTIDAAFTLAAAHAALGGKAPDQAARDDHFNKAYKAINKVYKYATGPEQREPRARADIELANIQQLEGAEDKALASYMRAWMLLKPDDPAHRKYKEIAYSKAMPLVAKLERWDEVLMASTRYLELYPRGPHAREAERWLTEARIHTAGQEPASEPEPEPAGSADEPPPAEPAPAGEGM